MGIESHSYCIGCKKNHHKRHFYVSFNPMHNGFTPYCKQYIAEYVYQKDGKLNMDNFMKILQLLDLPFKNDAWEKALSDGSDPVGMYFKRVKMIQYRDLTWKDSDQTVKTKTTPTSKKSKIDNTEMNEQTNEDCFNLKELQEKYGYGYTEEEYLNFERKYRKLTVGYKEKTAIHTERLLDYIVKKVKGEMATAANNVADAKKWEDLAAAAASAAKLNVSQLSKNDITGGIDLIPQLVEAVEEMVSIIPIMPKLKEQPYDDADLILWAIISKYREIEDKPNVSYREIWDFYDKFLEEYFISKGLSKEEVELEKKKRNNVFRDLGEVYHEPLYDDSLIEEDAEGDDL